MNRSEIRDLGLAAGVGLLLGVNMAFMYLTVGQVRDRLTVELTELLWTVVLIATVGVVVAFVLFVRARGASLNTPVTRVSSIRSYSRAAAASQSVRRLVP